jgi:glycosyltransferase involved in cell wall biosynthesis
MLVDRRSFDTVLHMPRPIAAAGEGDLEAAHVRHLSVSVVIPTKNEEQNIAWVLRKLPPQVDEVVLVDGLSTDRTVEVARMVRPDIKVVLERARGKGAAVRAGIRAASGDIIAMLDADCSMDPGELARFIEPVAEGFELVKGSRFMPGGGTSDITPFRSFGNRLLLTTANLLYGAQFTELCYGYMAFHRESVMSLALQATGFEIEAEIVTKSVRAGYRIAEVPSYESERRYGNSSLHAIRDGFRILRTMLTVRLRPAPRGPAPEPVAFHVEGGSPALLDDALRKQTE